MVIKETWTMLELYLMVECGLQFWSCFCKKVRVCMGVLCSLVNGWRCGKESEAVVMSVSRPFDKPNSTVVKLNGKKISQLTWIHPCFFSSSSTFSRVWMRSERSLRGFTFCLLIMQDLIELSPTWDRKSKLSQFT